MRAGSVAAFELLYDTFFPLLFRYGRQFCTDRAVLKDCLQDFFTDLYVRRASWSDVKHVKSYLYTAFRHRIIRQMSGQSQRFESLSDKHYFEISFSHEHSLILDQLDRNQRHYLQIAFQRLSSHQKEAIFLRFYEDLSYQEIADILKMKNVKYARTLVYRAISNLQAGVKDREGSLTLYSLLFWPGLIRLP